MNDAPWLHLHHFPVSYSAEALQRAITLANNNYFWTAGVLGHHLQTYCHLNEPAAAACARRAQGIVQRQRQEEARQRRRKPRKSLDGENDPGFDNAVRCLEDGPCRTSTS